MTKIEKKYWKDVKKLPYPLAITGATNKRKLEVIHPKTGEVLYTSNSFNERNFIQLYNTNTEFQQWFDYAVAVSAQQRIEQSLFRADPKNEIPVVCYTNPEGNGVIDENLIETPPEIEEANTIEESSEVEYSESESESESDSDSSGDEYE